MESVLALPKTRPRPHLHQCRHACLSIDSSRPTAAAMAGSTMAASPTPKGVVRYSTAEDGGPAGATPIFSRRNARSEEHTSELQSLMRNSYAVFCLKKKTQSTI